MIKLSLDELRNTLIRQEETIIFALIERAQFSQNPIIYQPKGINLAGFDGCFLDYLLWETEKVHARVRRYTSPDEHPFFENLPEPILPTMSYSEPIKDTGINVNHKIIKIYQKTIVPDICVMGDDQNYGSSATCDVACLQALSKRIHYGKFVAEAKFQEDRESYIALIAAEDTIGLENQLTIKSVEDKLLMRVEQKAAAYGRDIDGSDMDSGYKIEPEKIAEIYKKWVIPLTKEVEVQYLLLRLT